MKKPTMKKTFTLNPSASRRRAMQGAGALAAGSMLLPALSAQAQGTSQGKGPIRIGELNSYKAQPAFLEPYKKGMELALQEVNESGGVNGRKLELIIRDDGANPGDAVRVAEELISREKVDLITGTFLSNIGLAVTDFAKQRKVFFLASEPLTDKIVWQNGNRYTFRLRPSTYMQTAMLVPDAVKMNKKRWAVVYPNYEYGQSAVASFKELMKKAQPGIEFVAEQAPPLGRIDAGAVTQALADAKPDAIFNVLFGADLAKFVREGNTRGLFKGRDVVSLLTGEPEYIDPLKDETPEGWLVTGYPWYGVDSADHKPFFVAYYKKYNDYPRLGSVVGYTTIKALAAGLKKANSTDTEKMITAFEGLQFNGKGEMKDYRYFDGAKFLPSEEEAKKLRPAN
jgi:branched-chain amino acid transport system substrate-binding protein